MIAGIGHNGGPQLPKPKKLSWQQLRALRWIRDYNNSAYGLRGRSEHGGANNTQTWLRTHTLAFWDPAIEGERLTARGQRVLEAERMVP